MKDSFVYCWTDRATGKLYIGSHKGRIDDGYICSSKSMISEYKTRPEDFSREIIAEGVYKDIRKLEGTILHSLNAAKDPQFYNLNNQNGNFCQNGPLSEEHKRNVSASKKGKPARHLIGKPLLEETKQKISKRFKGVPKPNWWKERLKGKRPHVIQKGSKNNNAVPIYTPHGDFGSIRDASETLKISYGIVWYRVKRKDHPEWGYIK